MPSRRSATHDRRKTNRRASVPDTQPVPVPPTPVPTPTPPPTPTPVPPTPAPPPVSGSNEPSGLTLITDYGFTDPIPATQGGALGSSGWHINNGGGLATLVAGGGMQYLYQGNQNGGSPATAYFDAPTAPTTVYWRATWRASSNWFGSVNGVQKILYQGINSGGDAYLCLYGSGAGPFVLAVSQEYGGPSTILPGTHPVALGVNHTLEWLLTPTTVQVWLDGVLDINAAGRPATWGEHQLYGGYGLNTIPAPQTTVYSHVRITGK